MSKKKIIIIVVAVLLIAGLIFYYQVYLPNGQSDELMASGHVEVTEVDLSFRISGHIDRLHGDEGDQVHQGDLLAELNQEVLSARRDQAEAAVRELEASMDALSLGIQIKKDVLTAEENRAVAAVSAAEARYHSLKTGSREEEVAQAAADLKRAHTLMENSEQNYQRMKRLYGNNSISISQFEDARTSFESARANYLAVLERYNLVKAGPRKEEVHEGAANVSGSEATLKAAQAARREVEQMQLQLKSMVAKTDQAKAALAIAESDLKESRLIAPFNGFITVRDVEEKEFVQAGAPVLTMAQLDWVKVKAYIPETRLGRIRLGQEADVVTDSYPDKTYRGTIIYISPRAEFTPKNVQTKEERVKLVYQIKIKLDNPNQELKAGMPVDVLIR